MSYPASIHFDPTALLIIKKEIDLSIQQVESTVTHLVENQKLPFAIDDALIHFEQCANVLKFIELPRLAQLNQYSAQLMRKIMLDPRNINTKDVLALSKATTLLCRYIEFICLHEVGVPQFLLDPLNTLELALGKPLTTEGHSILSDLECIQPPFSLPQGPPLEISASVHKLYKLSLQNILKQQENALDDQALSIVAEHLKQRSQAKPSHPYWQLIHVAFSSTKNPIFTDARLRTLIHIETNIALFLESPETFKAASIDLADVLILCISQDDEQAQQIREQLNLGHALIADSQLQVLSRDLFGPDFQTIHIITKLITEEMTQIRNEIELNYQKMSEKKMIEIKSNLINLAHVFKVMNLDEASDQLKIQIGKLNPESIQNNQKFAQQLMNSILSAMNSIAMLERNCYSKRLQVRVNNLHISLDHLDNANDVLMNQTKALVNLSSSTLLQHLEHQETSLESVPIQLKEMSGALLFLGAKDVQAALLTSENFLNSQISNKTALSKKQIVGLLDVLASTEILVENIGHKQPIMQRIFDVALTSSQNLKAAV